MDERARHGDRRGGAGDDGGRAAVVAARRRARPHRARSRPPRGRAAPAPLGLGGRRRRRRGWRRGHALDCAARACRRTRSPRRAPPRPSRRRPDRWPNGRLPPGSLMTAASAQPAPRPAGRRGRRAAPQRAGLPDDAGPAALAGPDAIDIAPLGPAAIAIPDLGVSALGRDRTHHRVDDRPRLAGASKERQRMNAKPIRRIHPGRAGRARPRSRRVRAAGHRRVDRAGRPVGLVRPDRRRGRPAVEHGADADAEGRRAGPANWDPQAPPPPPAPPAPPAAVTASGQAPKVQMPMVQMPKGQLVNVKVEFTITDQLGAKPPTKKTMTLTVADRENGRIRTNTEYAQPRGNSYQMSQAPLSVDVHPDDRRRQDPAGFLARVQPERREGRGPAGRRARARRPTSPSASRPSSTAACRSSSPSRPMP